MRTTPILATLALLAAGLAVVPSAEAAQPPIYCVMAPCGPEPLDPCPVVNRWDGSVHTYSYGDCHLRIDVKGYDCVWNCGWRTYVQGPPVTVRVWEQTGPAESSAGIAPPPVCGPAMMCTGPECPETRVATSDLLAYMGPHAGASLSSGCSPAVWHDPLLVAAAAPPIQPPPQCVLAPCCGGPCPPPCDGCEDPPVAACRDVAVSTTGLLQYLGPAAGARLYGDCSALVWEETRVCPFYGGAQDHSARAGPVLVQYDTCYLPLDCTCDPMPIELAAAAAEVDPPVNVEPVVCVTDPCPPMVTCDPMELDGGVAFGLYVEQDCSFVLGLIDAYRFCHGGGALEHGQVRQTAGPGEVVVNYCAPAVDAVIDLTAASMADPFPTCVAPCFPQAPDGCDVKATLAGAGVPDLFGDDCTIDVEPSYHCVGEWGSDRYVSVAFVTVTVRVCTGRELPPIFGT
jgi:hypothetical protein